MTDIKSGILSDFLGLDSDHTYVGRLKREIGKSSEKRVNPLRQIVDTQYIYKQVILVPFLLLLLHIL